MKLSIHKIWYANKTGKKNIGRRPHSGCKMEHPSYKNNTCSVIRKEVRCRNTYTFVFRSSGKLLCQNCENTGVTCKNTFKRRSETSCKQENICGKIVQTWFTTGAVAILLISALALHYYFSLDLWSFWPTLYMKLTHF